jgi:hypothetical protein
MTGRSILMLKIFIGPSIIKITKFTVDTVYSHKTCPTDALASTFGWKSLAGV